jgi:hypothetical protein
MRLTSFSGKGGVKFSKKVKFFRARIFTARQRRDRRCSIRGTADYANIADIRNIDFNLCGQPRKLSKHKQNAFVPPGSIALPNGRSCSDRSRPCGMNSIRIASNERMKRDPECLLRYLNLRSAMLNKGRRFPNNRRLASCANARFGGRRQTAAAPWLHMRSPECLWRSLKVSSATPDLSSSPNPSATMRSYWSLVARASGNSRPRLRARLSAMPLSLAA